MRSVQLNTRDTWTLMFDVLSSGVADAMPTREELTGFEAAIHGALSACTEPPPHMLTLRHNGAISLQTFIKTEGKPVSRRHVKNYRKVAQT